MSDAVNKNLINEKKISIALMSSYVILTLQYLILIYFNLIATDTGARIQLISKMLVGIFYLRALPIVLKRNKIKFIAIYFISIFIFLINYLIFRENWPYLQDIIFPFFFTALPSFIYAYSLDNCDVLMDVMEKAGKIVFIVGALITFLTFTERVSIGAYSMSLSYYMLLPTILYMNDFLDDISLKDGILLIISLLIILALGSRGAIMCVGVFTALKFIEGIKNITYKKILVYMVIFSIIILGLLYLNEILEYIYIILLRYGIRSRSIALFLREDLYLSGRDSLYKNVINKILLYPILGNGLGGDRRILNGGYAHNIFIEMLANFGIIVGVLLITFLFFIIIRTLLTKSDKEYNMIIIWISIGFIHLFVSSSYLIDFKFWILLGLLKNKQTQLNLRIKKDFN